MKNFPTEDLDLIEGGKLTYYTWKIIQLERFTFYLKNYRERYNICVNLAKNADVLACVQGIINKISTLREGVFKDLTADINQDISENRNLAVANEQSIISQAKILFPETFANTSCTIEDVLNSNITKLAQNHSFGLQNVHLHNLLNSINYRKKLNENYDKLNGLNKL